MMKKQINRLKQYMDCGILNAKKDTCW